VDGGGRLKPIPYAVATANAGWPRPAAAFEAGSKAVPSPDVESGVFWRGFRLRALEAPSYGFPSERRKGEGAMPTVVRAIDVGYGNTKFVVGRGGDEIRCAMFPSVSTASMTNPGKNTLGERRRTIVVPVNGMFHEVGPDALAARDHFRPTYMHDGYIDTLAYRAFVCAAMNYMKMGEIDVLVLGLPVATFLQKKTALERAWIGEHDVGEGRKVRVRKAIVLAQPMGALAYYAHVSGKLEHLAREQSLVIDPGARTFDWLVTRGMTLVQNQSSSVNRGVFDIAKAIAKEIAREIGTDYRDYEAVDEALRSRKPLILYQKPYELGKFARLVNDIAEQAVSSMRGEIGDAAAFQNIVLVGGGGELFSKAVRSAFPKHQVEHVKDAIFANVRGFQLAGEHFAARQAFGGKGMPALQPKEPETTSA
jgi:plasmid segregation protein ParM